MGKSLAGMSRVNAWKVCVRIGFVLLIAGLADPARAQDYINRPEVKNYLGKISQEHGLSLQKLQQLFAGVTVQQSVLEKISRPAEKRLVWWEYRPIFVTAQRIEEGQNFLRQHRALLEQAENQYGVPAEIITAIIGVETFYGRIMGKHDVLSSLVTLAFDYPRRAEFFKRELTEFLILSDQQDWPADSIRGSYAGAMGMPQFIASSYRHYAVDFDDDGLKDLFTSPADIIGSVANYLSTHGWQRDQAIMQVWSKQTLPSGSVIQDLLSDSLKPSVALETVDSLGFELPLSIKEARSPKPVSVMVLEAKEGPETWVGFFNFYVITRYNHSHLYAMAVAQLAEKLS